MNEFQACIRAAQIHLFLDQPRQALAPLKNALRHANRMSPAHRRVTMRALNWTRAAAAKEITI
jgi:hypothetical protein